MIDLQIGEIQILRLTPKVNKKGLIKSDGVNALKAIAATDAPISQVGGIALEFGESDELTGNGTVRTFEVIRTGLEGALRDFIGRAGVGLFGRVEEDAKMDKVGDNRLKYGGVSLRESYNK